MCLHAPETKDDRKERERATSARWLLEPDVFRNSFLTLFLLFSFIFKGEDKEAESLVHIGEKTTLYTELNKLVCSAAPRVQRKSGVSSTGVTPDPAAVNTLGPDASTRAWRDTSSLSWLCLLTCFGGYSVRLVKQRTRADV